jgi:hypothetical protein
MKQTCRIKSKLPKIKCKRWFLNKLISGVNTIATKRSLYRYAGRSIFVSMDEGGNDISVISVTQKNRLGYHNVIDYYVGV